MKFKECLEIVEVIFNTMNHILIGITTFYMTWYCFNVGFEELITYHVLFTTLGYQLLMAEGIMSLYCKNTFTMLMQSKRQKTKVHLILQSVGSIFAFSGVIIQIVSRFRLQKSHFSQAHSIYGLISTIFLLITLLSGISSLFAPELRKYISPLLSKFFHNLIALAAFVTGMVSIIIAYLTKSWIIRGDPGNIRIWMVVFLSFSIVLTLIGPLKSMFFQIENKFFRR